MGEPTGSSPLARGTPARGRQIEDQVRFIPARAGNTAGAGSPTAPRPVHPRSRGEHPPPSAASSHRHGSSPLARGTPAHAAPADLDARFIPARAGNTAHRAPSRSTSPVHPRSRGEHSVRTPARVPLTGSSPLARGTLCVIHRDAVPRRFIPARAGNTGSRGTARRLEAVHPRSRGEHDTCSPQRGHRPGSSPLARGTQQGGPDPVAQERFIPARAGNTGTRRRAAPGSPVHPRSRGEHRLASAATWS